MLAPHSVQKPHAPHHHQNVKTQLLYSQIRRPIKPSSPSCRSIHPSLKSKKCRMQHFKCATNHHANCQPTAKPWSTQHQISTHLNLVSDYRGVKAKNEGVFDWLIRKKRKIYIYTFGVSSMRSRIRTNFILINVHLDSKFKPSPSSNPLVESIFLRP
jgi:hypothetical protein